MNLTRRRQDCRGILVAVALLWLLAPLRSFGFRTGPISTSFATIRTTGALLSSSTDDALTETTKFNSEDELADAESLQSIRQSWPLWLQYFVRDSGILRFVVNLSYTALLPQLIQDYPNVIPDFVRLSKSQQNWRYGSHRAQVVQFFAAPIQTRQKCLLFVHGGAWGSGYPAKYRWVANPFLAANYSVAIVGYRTYPTTDVQGQVDDLATAMTYIRKQLGKETEVVLMGHSSGAHISLLGLLQGKIKDASKFVGMSGVYDIPRHYQFERQRGIERISPLAPACGGAVSQWRRYSPLYQARDAAMDGLPPMLLCHGTDDPTVPPTATEQMFEALHQHEPDKHTLEIFQDVGHAETVLHLMFGGSSAAKVMDWIEKPVASTTATFNGASR